MIRGRNYKIIKIDIITYKSGQKMNEERYCDKRCCREGHNRFICSICLNKRPSNEENRNIECYKRKSRSCPVCHRSYDIDEYAESIVRKESNCDHTKYEKCRNEVNEKSHQKDKGKKVQTSLPDVTQGLTLLNEVLTVFQNKKIEGKNENSKTIILKDASVSTENSLRQSKGKLTVSKIFHYSIGATNQNTENKFTVLNYQPEHINNSVSIDLIKHKSSSIPQMKLEELKKTLKDKTKSKDAIEEVNRMFANVKKFETCDSLDDCNRPMIRNGPRVLPVVKTDYREENVCRNSNGRCRDIHQMSGGDSKEACIHKIDKRCPDCICSCRHIRRPVYEHCQNHKT